jgi:type VI secretion system protein ImpK
MRTGAGGLQAASTLPVPTLDQAGQARVLLTCARPLIALATQLRDAVLKAPEDMKQALAAAVARFEREASAEGCDERSVAAASYLLCTWVDEVAADTPWGAGGAGLLERFHGERDGGSKVLRLLSRLAEQPREHRALLELFHACLSLGLQGSLRRAPDGARQLEALRKRVFLMLPGEADPLSPPLHGAAPEGISPMRQRLALAALLLLGLAALGVYTAGHLLLAGRVDKIFTSMQQLTPAGSATAVAVTKPPPAGAIVAARAAPPLAPALAQDIEQRRLVVRDEAQRSVVILPADVLFESGSGGLTSSATALLDRVGASLARYSGKVVVVGHTDGADVRTARLPSAWDQSYEWAREVAEALLRTMPAQRVATEGAADLEPGKDPSVPRRRVELVLYP